MKLWLVAASVLCFSLPAALGLTCFDCYTTISWDGCRPASKTCHATFDRCAKIYTKVGEVETFTKNCIPNAACDKDANPTCQKAVGYSKCDINCCALDDCNAGSTFRISGILLLTCALASLMILVKA
ncbi:hypothetical protein OS493_005349 [Desmophyllum pertusum]|uniref:Uncharacterized protein n=1 Tax=Desmophyllum pertusum TaxID=174260 RepID=A0A9W9YS46_9CNID|nr:hypothetical protein OS493_005349 [Desmophyllum pertusum]